MEKKLKVLGSLVAIIVLVVCLSGCGKGKSINNKEEYSDAFFIKEESKYALFNNDGKKLTDFIFTSVSNTNFRKGSAIVKKDDAYGIIGSNGKMIVDFGKYKSIYESAGLYKVTDNDRNEYLLDSKGKVLYNLKDASVSTYFGVSSYSVLREKNSKKYSVLDSNGKALVSFSEKEGAENPTTNEEDGFISVFYNKKNYILDSNTGKKVMEFDSDKHYCINNVSEDGKIITMNSCVGMFQSQEDTTYKFIKDGKLYDLSDKCDKVNYYNDTLTCIKDSKTYLLDSKLNIGIATDSIAYIDGDHYIKLKDGAFNGVDFYNGDKVLKNVECRSISEYGYNKSGLYILSTYYSTKCGTTSGTYEYYNEKGENAFGKSFGRANKFDANGLASVSEDKKSFYLIDTKGKKVSDEYDSIYLDSDYYIVTKSNLKGILSNTGKVVMEAKYVSADVFEEQGVKYAKLTTEDSKYIIYNLTKGKEIITLDSNPSTNANYIYTSKDGKKTYYTYTGKEFYKEK